MAKRKSDLAQVGRFSAVGIINTALDFTLLNLLNVVFGLPRIPSNMLSATVAMIFSFLVNKRLVFRSKGRDYVRQAALFLLVTAAGLYILQSGVIYLLTEAWTGPLDLAYRIVTHLGLDQTLSKEFVFTNGAKVAATAFSMVWNFLWYKKVVFADDKKRKA